MKKDVLLLLNSSSLSLSSPYHWRHWCPSLWDPPREEDAVAKWRCESQIRVTVSARQNVEFPARFMRASRAPPLTNDTPWFPTGGCDDVSLRPRSTALPRTITVFLPSPAILFVRARRFRFTDFSDSVESSLASRPPSCEQWHKNRYRNRMPEAPTGVSSRPRGIREMGAPAHPPTSVVRAIRLRGGAKSDRNLINFFVRHGHRTCSQNGAACSQRNIDTNNKNKIEAWLSQ